MTKLSTVRNLKTNNKMETKLYSSTIQWQDDKTIFYNMILKIGDIEDDDDDIFFYMEDENEIQEFKGSTIHEWKILDCEEIEH